MFNSDSRHIRRLTWCNCDLALCDRVTDPARTHTRPPRYCFDRFGEFFVDSDLRPRRKRAKNERNLLHVIERLRTTEKSPSVFSSTLGFRLNAERRACVCRGPRSLRRSIIKRFNNYINIIFSSAFALLLSAARLCSDSQSTVTALPYVGINNEQLIEMLCLLYLAYAIVYRGATGRSP